MQYGAVFHGCMNIIVDQAMVADSMTGIKFNEEVVRLSCLHA